MPQKDHRLAGLNVLIVEDEASARHVLITLLTLAGAEVTAVPSAEQAMASFRGRRFDAVVSDIRLPGMSGLDLLKEVRCKRRTIPFIMVTGFSTVESAVEALRLGAQDYLVKPIVSAERLHDAVLRAVRLHQLVEANRRLQRRIKENEAVFRTLFHQATDACLVFTVDRDGQPGRLEQVNGLASSLSGYSPSELESRTLLDLLPPEHHADIIRHLLNARAGRAETLDTLWLSADKRRIPVEIRSHTFALGKRRMFLSAARDVSQRLMMDQRVTDAADRIQNQLGHDLHDILCQDLSSVAILSTMLARNLESTRLPGAADAATIREISQRSVGMIRRLSSGLFPVALERSDLAEALQDLTATEREMFHTPCRFDKSADAIVPAGPIALHLYRIAQEALANARKHAQAWSIRIELNRTPGNGTLTITDDGSGFKPSPTRSTGLGMDLMRHRARLIGAALDISSEKNKGTRITCTWPLDTSHPDSPAKPAS
ncbi:MAG: hypothetical protein A2498_16590 [Lentisphaerae bacterium RIFOXYC12_FULL_60_16]|nr:MAG: hypothetical protein A2498_16590 [Lentisphaerae bacterium RIFOXYC12_FULL_60_16]OGV85661.1 MAG: hypothetical protein A2340_13945 [Lentisphaerae bacterium RIFOXYB12_FULL_60_10]